MLTRLLLIFIVAQIIGEARAEPNENLNKILKSTTIFFDKLKIYYESQPPTPKLYKSVDEKISEYVNRVKRSTILSREKRHLDSDKNIGVLNGFERVPGLDLFDCIDLTFFVYRNGVSLLWYAATLNSSGISLFQYKPQTFIHVASHDLENGTRIISHSSENATLLVVQKSSSNAPVFRLYQEKSQMILNKVQTVDTPGATDSAVWRGVKKIQLAVSSPNNIKIFNWLGEHFDKVQTLEFGAKKIMPFQTGGSMHLVAIDRSFTSVLKLLPDPYEFVLVQRLRGAKDATTFSLEREHNGEYFLALAAQNFTIIYKHWKHRFVPFQKISSADKIRSMIKQPAISLFLLTNGSMTIYQYDGWKFVESSAKENGIFDVAPVVLQNKDFLALRLIFNKTNEPFRAKFENYSGEFESLDNGGYLGDDEFSTITNTRIFRKIIWGRRETWTSLRERTKIWCQDSLANKTVKGPPDVPQLGEPLRIEKGFIGTLRARQINGQGVEKFSKIAERLNSLTSKAKYQEKELKRYIPSHNPILKNLQASRVRLVCKNLCRAEEMETNIPQDFVERLRTFENPEQNLNFINVSVSYAKNLPCPFPAPKFHHVIVDGLVNGISFRKFLENAMTTKGDQKLSGFHTYAELRVSNAKIPLDVASNYTRQEIFTTKVQVDELEITSGDFLLPLKIDRPTILGGSLTTSKTIINGFVDLHGRIRGAGAAALSPMIYITDPLEVSGIFSFNSVQIVENLRVKDFTRSVGKSFNEIISSAIPLNHKEIPIHFKFRSDKVSWTNVTARNFPYNWLTKKNFGHVVVTGHKNATKPVIAFGKFAQKNLPVPRLPIRVCGIAAISEGIWESNLVIDRGFAKSVRAKNIFSDSKFSQIYLDSATSWEQVPWDLKNLTGRVTVKKANITSIPGMDYQGLKNCMSRWIEPGRLKGPVQFQNLKVHELITIDGFHVPLPSQVRNVEAKANIYIGTLNGIDVEKFMKNTVKIDETLVLTNITFAGGLDAEDIYASKTSFTLQENLSGYLGSKEILGRLESEEIIVPNLLELPSTDKKIDVIVNGNARFSYNPKVININDQNLELLYNELWLPDRPTKISAERIEFKNVSFENDLEILKSFDTPNLGPWAGLENRLLSKTRSQTIRVDASFNFIEAPNLIASKNSHLRSNVSWLSDLEINSLKNNDTQTITNDWKFDELIVTGNFDLRGRINRLNFSTDIVRKDVGKNIITGKKISRDFSARNIDGLKFDEFADNALRKNNTKNKIVVKGWKTFKSVEMRNISLKGTIFGKRIENSLLKSASQKIQGSRIIRGFVDTPEIVVEGLVNGIKLKNFVDYQLKKRAPLQIIKTPINLKNNVTIFGNLTIDGLYQDVELKNFENVGTSFLAVAKKTSELMDFAEEIELALDNRAIYWEKLEFEEKNSKPLVAKVPKAEILDLEGLGECKIVRGSVFCEDKEVLDELPVVSSKDAIVLTKIVELSGSPIVVYVISDPDGRIFIFRYNPDDRKFYKITELHLPEVIRGSLTTLMDSLWISLDQRDQTTILRYELSSGFQEWILPGQAFSLMSSSPTGELLIFRSDGVWKLGGLAGPRHIFRGALDGHIDTFTSGMDYYVQLIDDKNGTTLLKTRYVGN